MSNQESELESTKKIREERDYSAIVNEYKELYGSMESQIELFSQSQPKFIQELTDKVQETLSKISPEKAEIITQAYGILLMEDIFKRERYDIESFSKDVNILSSFYNKKEISDKEYLAIITAFRKNIEIAAEVIYNIGRLLVTLKGNKVEDDIIQALIIRREVMPACKEMNETYKVAGITPDLRWLANHLAIALENIFLEKKIVKHHRSFHELYQKILEDYPLGNNLKILWDLLLSIVILPYYDNLIELYTPEIKELAQRLEYEKEASKKSYERAQAIAAQQGRTEQIRSAIDSILLETLKLNWDLTESKKQRLKKNMEIIIKRMAIEKYGVQDIKDSSEYFIFLEEAFFVIFDEYPQLLVPIMEPKDYQGLVRNPVAFIKNNRSRIKQQIGYHLRKNIKGTRYTPKRIAEGFSDLLITLLEDPKIKRFDFK
ncbi:MAG: hypothetical protein GF308_00250 [Candidatus Heimdallarchaeota archaeon]|nr:hypothetical protein [Candidatus Heimdallarchaeota archaeon]